MYATPPVTFPGALLTVNGNLLTNVSTALWSGFNQVIGWTRFREREERGEGSQITTMLDPYLTWTDVDADEFPSDAPLARTTSNNTVTAGSKGLAPLSPSLDASPLHSRAVSEYEQGHGSVSGSAAPEPLFSVPNYSSPRSAMAREEEEDVDATPRIDASGMSSEERDYFGRAGSISGVSEVSESESRIASFEVRAREHSRDREELASRELDLDQDDLTPGPRFWDNVSGVIGSPGPATVMSAPSVRASEFDAHADDTTVVGGEGEGQNSSVGGDRTEGQEDLTPRFWDDVSGGIGGPPPGSSCRQS